MNKHLYWVLPAGVAAGLSLPLLVPARKEPPAPVVKPIPPSVTVEGFALRPKQPKPVVVETPSVVVDDSDALGSLTSDATSAPAPMARRQARHRARLDAKAMRRYQIEDSRAWEAANRMLMYERRGA